MGRFVAVAVIEPLARWRALGGRVGNPGIFARRAALITALEASEIVTSPLIQIASTPREMREFADSSAAVLLSAFASARVIPRSAQTARAIFVWATELASAEFQTRPTDFNSGRISRALRKMLATGC